MVASEPTLGSVDKLGRAWARLPELRVLGGPWLTDAAGLLRSRTHLRSHESLRRLARELIDHETFEQLAVPFLGPFRQLHRRLPLSRAIHARYWRVPAAEVPRERDELIAWLFDWWRTIDDWIDQHALD